jgi:small subunit ribosomal protein S6
MRNYELVCILDPQASEGQLEGVIEKYDHYFKANGAEVVNVDRWGLRRLAYTSANLKKRRQGYYVLYQFKSEPGVIDLLEQELKLDEAVLRYLVVGVEGDFLRVPTLASEDILKELSAPRTRGRGGPGERRSFRRPPEEEEADEHPPHGRQGSNEEEKAEAVAEEKSDS